MNPMEPTRPGSGAAQITLEDAGRRLAQRLRPDEPASLPAGVVHGLIQARSRALATRRLAHEAVAAPRTVEMAAGPGGGAHDPRRGMRPRAAGWWLLAALVVGLAGIQHLQSERDTRERLQLDIQLLVGEIPPRAYTDPGFVAYLQRDTH